MRNLLFLICVLAMPGAALAQTPASWENLSALRGGQNIQIVEVTSKKHLGSFVNFSDTAISFRESSGDQTLQKQDVRSVRLKKGRGLRRTLIGAAIGAGAGAGIVAGAWESNGFLGGKGAGAAVGAAIGFVAGAAVGAFLPSHETIYSAAPH